MELGIFIAFIVGIFLTALGYFYNWGGIIYLFIAVTLASGIGLFVIYQMKDRE